MQTPFLKQKGVVMSDVTLFNKFKELIEETYGDDFFELDFLKTNSDLKKKYPRLSRAERDLNSWTEQYCSEFRDGRGKVFGIKNDEIVEGGYCIAHDSYFACVLKPINPPLGNMYLLVVSKNGSTYNYKWTDYYYDGSVSSNTLKGLLSEVPSWISWGKKIEKQPEKNLFLKLKSLIHPSDDDEEYEQSEFLSIDDLRFLYSLKGHQTFNKHTFSSIKRIKEIGNRFPKGQYHYLYRALVNELFYSELEDSFEITCGSKEEVILEKDLSEKAKRYFKILVRGIKSWSSLKDAVDSYRYPEHEVVYGGSILLIWVRPPKEDIALDARPTLDYIHSHGMGDPWAIYYEVLAEPRSAKIVGIKRIKNWKYCEYVIYLKS